MVPEWSGTRMAALPITPQLAEGTVSADFAVGWLVDTRRRRRDVAGFRPDKNCVGISHRWHQPTFRGHCFNPSRE